MIHNFEYWGAPRHERFITGGRVGGLRAEPHMLFNGFRVRRGAIAVMFFDASTEPPIEPLSSKTRSVGTMPSHGALSCSQDPAASNSDAETASRIRGVCSGRKPRCS